jgi:hypothetical protein
LKLLYNTSDIGILSSTSEPLFGIAPLVNKALIVGEEVTKQFSKSNPAGDMKIMIEGGRLSIREKYMSAVSKLFDVPMFLFGNEDPGYYDSAGSFSRRFMILLFTKKVMNVDTDLPNKIEKEIGNIILRCKLEYDLVRRKVGTKSIWDYCPAEFTQNRKMYQIASSPVIGFLLDKSYCKLGTNLKSKKKAFLTSLKEYTSMMNIRYKSQHLEEALKAHGIVERRVRIEQNGTESLAACFIGVELVDEDEGIESESEDDISVHEADVLSNTFQQKDDSSGKKCDNEDDVHPLYTPHRMYPENYNGDIENVHQRHEVPILCNTFVESQRNIEDDPCDRKEHLRSIVRGNFRHDEEKMPNGRTSIGEISDNDEAIHSPISVGCRTFHSHESNDDY